MLLRLVAVSTCHHVANEQPVACWISWIPGTEHHQTKAQQMQAYTIHNKPWLQTLAIKTPVQTYHYIMNPPQLQLEPPKGIYSLQVESIQKRRVFAIGGTFLNPMCHFAPVLAGICLWLVALKSCVYKQAIVNSDCAKQYWLRCQKDS